MAKEPQVDLQTQSESQSLNNKNVGEAAQSHKNRHQSKTTELGREPYESQMNL